LAGFSIEKQESLSYSSGTVHLVSGYYLWGPTDSMGSFTLGTNPCSAGDSGKNNNSVWSIKHKTLGAACWSSRGLIGISIGRTTISSTSNHLEIADSAIFRSKNIICPAVQLKKAYEVCL
jgi:hypothetical protein